MAVFAADLRADIVNRALPCLAVQECAVGIVSERGGKAIAENNLKRLNLHPVFVHLEEVELERENPAAFRFTALDTFPHVTT